MTTISEFVSAHGIRFSATYVGHRHDAERWPHHEWRCILRLGRKRLTTPMRIGVGHGTTSPTVETVLDSLLLDSEAEGRSFEEWAGDFGYDADSRKAEKTYRACVKVAERLRRFLGDDGIESLRECERL